MGAHQRQLEYKLYAYEIRLELTRPLRGALTSAILKIMARKKKKTKKLDPTKKFTQRYFEPSNPASYGGLSRFLRGLPKVDRSAAEEWLLSQEAYAIHKPFVKKFKRRKVIAFFQDQLQADLIDLVHIAKDNDRYRYLLTVIDVFSKKAHVRILRNKDAATVASAFQEILDDLGFVPRVLHTDQGSEFIAGKFQALLKRRGIKYFTSTDSTIKCAVIERFNRTIMSRLYRYFSKHNSYRYIEVLPDIIKSYNATPHSSIGLPPNEVNHTTKERVWLRIHNSPPTVIAPKVAQLKLGTYVRIAKRVKTFEKGYKSQWSGEIFKINKIKQTSPKTFNLVDLLDDPILGSFYGQELNPTKLPETYAVEAVLDVDGGRVLVKWKDYPEKFNSWIPKKSIESI